MLNTERLCLGCMNDNGGEKVCPICGYDSASQNPTEGLPVKSFLKNRYLLGKMLGKNGEGITYIGWDNANDTIINIKEYFPTGISQRNPDKTVSIIPGNEYLFNEGLLEFKEIKCNIMASGLPAVIPVTDVFEENGTVYSIETNIAGITLENFLNKNGGTLKWEQARALFLPLIDTLKELNDMGVIHRGISADTVIVGRDGKLRISNYSIKNFRITPSKLETEIYSGYAAIEQYGFEELHTDTYTDVFGLSATIFRVLIGTAPPDANVRIQNDSMSVPTKFAEELPRPVLAALANGLQILPKDRTRDIESFKNQLVYGEIPHAAPPKRATAKVAENNEDGKSSKKESVSAAKYVLISAGCTALIFIIIGAVLVFGVFGDKFFGNDKAVSSESTEIEMPETDEIGDVDSNASLTSKPHDVPDFTGKYYSQIINDDKYEMFEFAISAKVFSDKHPKGTVCSQSVAPNSEGAVRGTKIEFTISLGPKEIKIANLSGYTKEEAILELLKQGFLYNNIEIINKFDQNENPGVVIAQEPTHDTKVSTDVGVKIYINSYTGSDSEEESSQEDTSEEN